MPAWGPVSDVDKTTNLTTYAEWYAEMMSVQGTATWQHHLATYGPLFNYDDFIGQWQRRSIFDGVRVQLSVVIHPSGCGGRILLWDDESR